MRWFKLRKEPEEQPKQLYCNCFEYSKETGYTETRLHRETQDTDCRAWKRMVELVDQAAKDGREVFKPREDMELKEWYQIVTLPANIARLKWVKHLELFGSSLIFIPPEIGQMSSLERLDLYTSYRLHWLPYEITHCPQLKSSSMSTRALYGNYKFRPPFPRLPALPGPFTPKVCSVCRDPFLETPPLQYWISLRVATDVFPLLVHACSEECIRDLPAPAERYVAQPHQGGLDLQQPDSGYLR